MFVVPTPRRAFRFTIRTMLIIVAGLGLVLAVHVNRASRQRRAVAKLEQLGWPGVSVQYDYQLSRAKEPPGPAWLRNLLGVDYFDNVVYVGGSASIGDEHLTILHEFPRLSMVDLSSWHVSSASLVQLRGLPELAHVELVPFNATNEALAILGTLTQLKSLTVVCEVRDDDSAPDNRVTDEGLAHLKNLNLLDYLLLEDCSISDAGLKHLKALTNLEWLGIRFNGPSTRVTDESLVCVKTLLKLDSLELSGTAVTDEGLVHLTGLANIEILDISHTAITDEGLDHLEHLPKLKDLWAYDTQITAQGAAEFQKRVPRCKVKLK